MRDLVLVGAGHTHVQLLRGFAMEPPAGLRLTLVVDRPVAVYSGMVPGYVAGQYARPELEIDARPLAIRAGARVIVSAATSVDAKAGRIELEGRPPLPYDLAAFDVGSRVAGAELPGVRDHALPTRPIGDFVRQVGARILALPPKADIVVVGGGAGGVELAFALRARTAAGVVLLEAGEQLLAGAPRGLVQRVLARAEAAGVEIRTGAWVEAVSRDAVRLEGGELLPCDAAVWVGGAAAPELFRASGLPTDEAGFLRVGPTLQVPGHPELFACGDCASFEERRLPKAGVYAVRAGPALLRNLRAVAAGRAPRPWRPQRDFLALLNTGDGRALGAKWGFAFGGEWVFRWKDRIDRRFMRRFQVLDEAGALNPGFPEMPGMSAEEVACGGCAAKVGARALTEALGRIGAPDDPEVPVGLAAPDDAAAVRTPQGELVVSSLDLFRAFTDDPFLVGRVAAVNAASDLWAKGVAPRFALAQVQVPEEDAAESLFQVLAGARAAFDPEGVTLVGGHSTTGGELQVGFAVQGFASAAEDLLRLGGLRPGDRLILTKPLGTGVLFHADMRALARGPWIEAAVSSMVRSNAAAARVARELGASACTDVSGFGLAGHLGEMLRAGKVAACVALDALPLLPGVACLLGRGLRSTLHPENARERGALLVAPELAGRPGLDVLFDPQTSGGLLFGVAPEREAEALAALRRGGDPGAVAIGTVERGAPEPGRIQLVASGACREPHSEPR